MKRYKKTNSFFKFLLIFIPIIIIGLILIGVWAALKEYNKSLETINLDDNGLSTDEILLSEDDSKKVLTLVTPTSELPENYHVNLQKFKNISCEKLIIDPLKELISDAKKNNINLVVSECYVESDKQNELFNQKVDELMSSGNITRVRAESEAKKTVPPANYSEGQTGLSVKFDTDNQSANFTETDAYNWLINNSVNYGFILRYPKSKETETGMTFNPNYFRYVGVNNAKKMRAMDMCLNEYCDYIDDRT